MGKELAQELEPEITQEEIAAAETEAPAEEEQRPEKPAVDKATEVQNNLKAAMQEERKKRQEVERQYRAEKEEVARRNAVLEDRLQQLYGAMQPQQPQLRDPQNDPDPIAATHHNQQLTWQAMQELHRRQQANEAKERQQQQVSAMANWAAAQANEFKRENADYDHAYAHMVKMRAAELEAMGLDMQAVRATIQQDEMWIIQSAAQTGRNPAELVYNMAKATGYKGPAPEKPTDEQKIETLQKGVAASKDLGNGPPTGKPSAQQIADMTDEEFAEFAQKLKKQGKRVSDVL